MALDDDSIKARAQDHGERHAIRNGDDWYARIGTERSKGTKVFALAGRVVNTGLVEVPMGITLREVLTP
jgi:NADH:ubiquinone oxidoreductase subunit F (NADH-binding)